MTNWIRAFALFGLLVAVPFLVERLLGRNAQMPLGGVREGLRESLNSSWQNVLSYSGFAIVVALLIGFLILLLIYLPQTYQISEYLNLAEREMNHLLRGWGGGWSADARKNVVKERAEWLSMIPNGNADLYNKFFELNQADLASGGPQGGAMGKARITAFLLREIYEGNVRNAQLKIINEVKNGAKPFIAPGIRQILDYDSFEKDGRFGPGVGWFPLMLTVKMHRYPRKIIMVKADKSVVENWDVLHELNSPLRPKA